MICLGYVGEEKIAIARQYLIPTSTKESGLSSDQIEITDNALMALIKSYCRESGVRNLQKHIEKVCMMDTAITHKFISL